MFNNNYNAPSVYGLLSNNNDEDEDEIGSVYGFSKHTTKNGQIEEEMGKNEFEVTIYEDPNDKNNNITQFFSVIMNIINNKQTLRIKHILPNNNKQTLKNKFETEGFKETLQRWSVRANTKTQDLFCCLYILFNKSIFTECPDDDDDEKDFSAFKHSLDLEWLPWNRDVWNLMTSPENGMSLFHTIPQSTTTQFYKKAFDFIILAYLTLPQISVELWAIFWKEAFNNDWCNTGLIFKKLWRKFVQEICKNANKCTYYLGRYIYISLKKKKKKKKYAHIYILI